MPWNQSLLLHQGLGIPFTHCCNHILFSLSWTFTFLQNTKKKSCSWPAFLVVRYKSSLNLFGFPLPCHHPALIPARILLTTSCSGMGVLQVFLAPTDASGTCSTAKPKPFPVFCTLLGNSPSTDVTHPHCHPCRKQSSWTPPYSYYPVVHNDTTEKITRTELNCIFLLHYFSLLAFNS